MFALATGSSWRKNARWPYRFTQVSAASVSRCSWAPLVLARPHVDHRPPEFGVPQQRRQVVDRQHHRHVVDRAVRRRPDRPIGQLAPGEQPHVAAARDRRRLLEADPSAVTRRTGRRVRWWKWLARRASSAPPRSALSRSIVSGPAVGLKIPLTNCATVCACSPSGRAAASRRCRPRLGSGDGRDRLAGGRRSRDLLAGAGLSHGCLAREVAAERARVEHRGLGRPSPGARGRRRAVGRWRAASRRVHRRRTRATLDDDDAHPADPAYLGARPGLRRGPPGDPLVAEHGRWEHAGQRYFDGEVEPCINGRTIESGAYFGVEVAPIVERILGERLADGGWTREAETDWCALVRHDDRRARRPARVAWRPAARPTCARPAARESSTYSNAACSAQEHGRGR